MNINIISELETDILVVGGGPAGIMAAKAASLLGEKVTLIERYGFLGGAATMSLVVPLMTFHAGEKQVIKGLAQDLLDEIAKLEGTIGHISDPIGFAATVTPVETEAYKYAAQEFLLQENVEILYHTEMFLVEHSEEKINSIIVKTRSGFYRIKAKQFIDASGDGELAYLSGNPMDVGRDSDGKTQPMSMMFKIAGIDNQKLIDYADSNPQQFVLDKNLSSLSQAKRIAVSGFFEKVAQAQEMNDLNLNRDRVLLFELNRRGEALVNMSRVINKNAVNGFDLSEATIEGRRQVYDIIAFFKKYLPGFENVYLQESASQIGVRETRRLKGHYCVEESDVLNGTLFEDTVALCAWPIDIHSPDGKDMEFREHDNRSYFGIPYRSMLPMKSKNLIVTGRAISASHVAYSSTRISSTCMALGQAAGVAAHLAQKEQVNFDQINVKAMQRILEDQNAILR